MVQTIIEIVPNPHVSKIEECVEKEQIPSKDVMNNIIHSAFDEVSVDYTVEYTQINNSENRYTTMGVANGNGNCVVYDESGTELNDFDYEISYGLLNGEPDYDGLEVVIHLTQE